MTTNSNEITRDVSTIPSEFSKVVILNLLNLISEIIVVILLISTLIFYNPIISLIVLVVISPIILIYYKSVNKKIKVLGEEVIEKDIKYIKIFLKL